MENMRTCPVCQAAVEPDQHECSRCGFKLVGRTEELVALGVEEVMPEALEEVCGRARLTVTKGPLEGESFYLETMPVTVGRDPKCDLFLNNMTVSRRHAIIERNGQKIMVKDNNSLNGTWVDGQVVEEAELKEGSLLQIGTFNMRFSCS